MKRPLLLPLTPLYTATVATRNALYNTHVLSTRSLTRPVISVGNLSTGGAGKTPFVLALAELLSSIGWPSDVLTRGYGRSACAIAQVSPDGSLEQFGDEPLLLARRGLSVFVGADRFAAGQLAERSLAAPRLHILDDGMQHRRLARDVEIVLVHRDDLFDRLLPAGNLREPLSSLNRAHILVLREEDASLAGKLRAIVPAAKLWLIRRTLRFTDTNGSPETPIQPLAFCAIARPTDFFASLHAHGCTPIATESFRDHHRYTAADAATLTRHAHSTGAHSFLTTAKDLCNLAPTALAALTPVAPLHIAELSVSFVDPSAVAADLRTLLPPA
jgi:tetraacyldisaccharide 4'-kinase